MAFFTLRVIVPNHRRCEVLNILDEVESSPSYPTLSIYETDDGFDVWAESVAIATTRNFLERAGGVVSGNRTVIFDDSASDRVIVLHSAGKAQVAFSSVEKMCAWLHPQGSIPGRPYTRMTIPLDPKV
jgi:hypothetical protein